MKTPLIHIPLITLGTLLLLLTACSKSTDNSSTSPIQPKPDALAASAKSTAGAAATAAAKARADFLASQPKPKTEVEQLADKLLAENLTQCGESWIGIGHAQMDGNTNHVILEARGVSLSIEPQSLSDADRLNGIEWKGGVESIATARRLYWSAGFSSNVNGGKEGWSKWQSTGTIIGWVLEKKEGKWNIHTDSSYDFYTAILEPISCDQKPQ